MRRYLPLHEACIYHMPSSLDNHRFEWPAVAYQNDALPTRSTVKVWLGKFQPIVALCKTLQCCQLLPDFRALNKHVDDEARRGNPCIDPECKFTVRECSG